MAPLAVRAPSPRMARNIATATHRFASWLVPRPGFIELEWWITPFGLRAASAMFKASSTSWVASVVPIDQPTMRRLKASSTTARHRKPA